VVWGIHCGAVLERLGVIRRGRRFVGSPLSEADLQEAADAVARMFRLVELMAWIVGGEASGNQLHSLVMAVWPGGFKAGVQHGIRQCEES